ncbi:MAG: hypothetical protein ACOVSR_09730 [Bacteroidia bacterium]
MKRKKSNDWQISTYVLDQVVKKWDRDEAIMNLRDRIKELELENGILKSESNKVEYDRLLNENSILRKNNENMKAQMESKYYKKFKKNKYEILEYLRRSKL